jgi:N6-adenosine-specific RNA methylase IME4
MSKGISLSRVRRDGGTQPRAGLDEPTVESYAEALRDGARLPPVGLVFDGTDYWLWDGFHRAAAHERAGLSRIDADVIAGTRRDAVLLAVGANAAHGLPRTHDDKRRALLILLGDAEWSAWSDREIAARAHVSHTFVAKLRGVTGNVASERTYATKHGTVATMDTAAIGKRAADYATIRSVDPLALYRAFKEDKDARQIAKKARREEREVALGDRIAAGNAELVAMAQAGKRYGVILADPEWRFEPWSRESGMDRAADNHYPTTPADVIASRPVCDIAADDCALFLWATRPMLREAFTVIDGWGFTYRSCTVWGKRRSGEARGPGYVFTDESEVLMYATRGNVPAPAPGTQWPSLFIAPVGRHSQKPDRVYELIESYFPTLPKIELNARVRRPGFDVWGAEAPDAEPAELMGRPKPAELDAWRDVATDLPVLPRGKGRAS